MILLLTLFISILLACAVLIYCAYLLAKKKHCPHGEDHFVCMREWLKAGAPLVAIAATSIAAVGGWIALQSLNESQRFNFERAADIKRGEIAAIKKEKDAFLHIYKYEFLDEFVADLRRPQSERLDIKQQLERVDGLRELRSRNINWLSTQYGVISASAAMGKDRHRFDEVTAKLAIALEEVIMASAQDRDAEIKKREFAVTFYDNDWKTVCDSYWDALDDEMVHLQAIIADLDAKAFQR